MTTTETKTPAPAATGNGGQSKYKQARNYGARGAAVQPLGKKLGNCVGKIAEGLHQIEAAREALEFALERARAHGDAQLWSLLDMIAGQFDRGTSDVLRELGKAPLFSPERTGGRR